MRYGNECMMSMRYGNESMRCGNESMRYRNESMSFGSFM